MSFWGFCSNSAKPLDNIRKKLDTHFPAARIKKITQADEDVGKVATAVPLLVFKALEMFLQDLCNRTYDITLKRGGKSLNSLHLKQCAHTFNVFDFLRETVGKAPELGSSVTAGEDRSVSAIKRRVTGDEENNRDAELKKSCIIEAGRLTSSGRRRGRGRCRGRGRGSLSTERDLAVQNEKSEDELDGSKPVDRSWDTERKECGMVDNEAKENDRVPVRDFDLNVDLDEENGDLTCNMQA